MRFKSQFIVILLLISNPLYAHTGNHIGGSFFSGLLHPLTGIDHLLVLVAVGLIAARQGGRALLTFPAVFFSLVAAGALLNTYGVQIPFAETLIALSLIAFGLLLAIPSARSDLFFIGVSFFAVFHGYVHAAEIPVNVDPVWYFSSLMLMSLMLCFMGCWFGLKLGRRSHDLFSFLCLSSGFYFLTTG